LGLYHWTNDVLLPSLYYTHSYNGNVSTSYENGYLADMYSWRLGPPKMRQLRVSKGLSHNTTYISSDTIRSSALWLET